MSTTVTGLTVQEFASKPYIRRALQEPQQIKSVLSFFFGADYYATPSTTPSTVQDGSCIPIMSDLWYNGGPNYDELCQPFKEVVRKAGSCQLPKEEWSASLEGRVAQMLLTDQLARNIFRNSNEAFAYEDVSLDLARQLARNVLAVPQMHNNIDDEKIIIVTPELHQETMYPPYLTFTITALMHSESLSDHEDLCIPLLALAKQYNWWEFQMKFEEDHLKVIRQFNRYPHRNKLKGRESTPEEIKWLADTENLPGWARMYV